MENINKNINNNINNDNNIENYINKCFCMDNLELIKELPSDSIDLIYCDILYNTGKRFKDYDDKLGTPQKAMEWYKPRLIEMKRILRDTGSIYLQCDYRLVHYLKVEMDNIFGIENFRNEIIWSYRRWSAKSNSFQNMHDNILFYSKTNLNVFNEQYEITERLKKAYKQGYNTNTTKSGRKQIIVTNKDKIKNIDLSKYDEIIYKEEKGTVLNDVWNLSVLASNSKERVGYDTQKPKALAERIIKTSSNEGDIIADFFCGSGTTGVVTKELNRKYILCDINLKAIEISEKRLAECEVDKQNTNLKNK